MNDRWTEGKATFDHYSNDELGKFAIDYRSLLINYGLMRKLSDAVICINRTFNFPSYNFTSHPINVINMRYKFIKFEFLMNFLCIFNLHLTLTPRHRRHRKPEPEDEKLLKPQNLSCSISWWVSSEDFFFSFQISEKLKYVSETH